MGIMVYSLLWVMQDFVHQPYYRLLLYGGSTQASGQLDQPLLRERDWALEYHTLILFP